MARPRIKIDKEQFEKLCSIQCTLEEIAGYFNCTEDTIQNWCKREYGENFSAVYAKKRGVGKISLRRSQFRMAETNPTMAIWLGKQYLGQTERQEIAVSHSDDDTIKEMEQYFDNKRIEDGNQQESDS